MTIYEQKSYDLIEQREILLNENNIFIVFEIRKYRNLVRILMTAENRNSSSQKFNFAIKVNQKGFTNNIAVIGQNKEVQLRPNEKKEIYRVDIVKGTESALTVYLSIYDFKNKLLHSVVFDVNDK